MCNNWLTIGPLTIHGYGFMIAVGILVSLTITERKAKSRGLSETIVDNMLWLGLLFGFLGAKLLYLIVNWQDFIQDPLHFIGSSGWVVYG
ncbi:MAG: prolipoprotein diacylglyceryl transferase, partial [Solobacterium sp.]|nr:prolipoprotein diacylglyceryl transferase [Solobacterium sp.]